MPTPWHVTTCEPTTATGRFPSTPRSTAAGCGTVPRAGTAATAGRRAGPRSAQCSTRVRLRRATAEAVTLGVKELGWAVVVGRGGLMQFREFSAAFNTAKRRIQREGVVAVAPAEEQLQAMLAELESDEDRRVGGNLIKRLPRYAVPAEPPSALMLEAMAVEREAFESQGTAEERIAV